MMAQQVIGNVEVTLELGKRYYAARPLAQRHQTQFPVKIYEVADHGEKQVAEVKGFGYDEATDFINEFNTSDPSWEGRIW